MEWFLKALKNYAGFSGRAQRSEYWYFILFFLIGYIALVLVDRVLGSWSAKHEIGLLSTLFAIGLVVPSIAVAARRLHDIGMSGWWQLISLVPIIGPIIMIVLCAKDSQGEANAYGPSPKRGDDAGAPGAV